MGTTDKFLKLRSTGTPTIGEWNYNYDDAMNLAKKNNKFIVTCWSNGDNCGYCTAAEKCMMEPEFIEWMKTSDAYFVFQYSGDFNKGKVVHDWCYNRSTGLKYYPGYRVTIFDANNTSKIAYDDAMDGNTLRGKKTGKYGARQMIANLTAMMSHKPSSIKSAKSKSIRQVDYKVRLNEKLTVAKINKILDAIDDNDGYCPCQVQSDETKCHCKDFIDNKKIGEPCICRIYVKQKKITKKISSRQTLPSGKRKAIGKNKNKRK